MAACSARSEPGTAAPSTTDRAISWRNATPRPCRSSRPVPVSTSTVAVATPSAASSSAPTGSGVHDSSSRHRRASGASPAVRASTASRTLSGSGDSGWARIWLTKNGLPAVRRWTSAGSSRCPSRSVATADLLSGVSCSRRASGELTRSPRTGRSGWSAPSASRYDSTSSSGSVAIRRARNRTRSSVASSAQCRSSTTNTRGRARRASSTAEKISCWAAVPRSRPATSGPSSCATSRNGPSGRGVLSESHMPHSGCAVVRVRSMRARRRTVLPMPASPATRTTDPWPAAARRARSSITSRGCSRSSSSII